MCTQVLLDARHVLFSLATKASRLPPASIREMLVRARDKVLLDRAAEITLDFWRSARPAADAEISDDKFNAAKLRAVVRCCQWPISVLHIDFGFMMTQECRSPLSSSREPGPLSNCGGRPEGKCPGHLPPGESSRELTSYAEIYSCASHLYSSKCLW